MPFDSIRQMIAQGNLGLRDALAKARENGGLQKTINIAVGLGIENVELGLRNLVPARFSWFRERIFRNPNAQGSAVAWHSITSRDTTNRLGYVPEGKRAGKIQIAKQKETSDYSVIGLEDSFTEDAEDTGALLLGSEAATEQLMISNLLTQFGELEERVLPFANQAVALGTPAAPTGVAAAGGALAADDYWCAVVALTIDGWKLASLTSGLVKSQAITTGAGESYSLNGGCSKRGTTSGGVSAVLNNKITWALTDMPGAFAYAWFVGKNTGSAPADTAFYLQGITTINTFVQTSHTTAYQTLDALGLGTTDYSAEPLAPRGFYYQALAAVIAGSDFAPYYHSMDGSPLTMNNGRVDQLTALFEDMFERFEVGPEALHMAPKTYLKLEELAYSSSNPRVMFVFPDQSLAEGITLGGGVVGIRNSLTDDVVPLVKNPNVPPGYILGARLGYPVPGSASPRSVEWTSFGGAWRVNWTKTTREEYHGIYTHGAVKLYHPGMFPVIANIKFD